jgi:hypothetical protein
MSFSRSYISSPAIRALLDGLPESDRDGFLRSLEESMRAFDAFDGLGLANSSIAQLLGDSRDEIPKDGERRPPRRR